MRVTGLLLRLQTPQACTQLRRLSIPALGQLPLLLLLACCPPSLTSLDVRQCTVSGAGLSEVCVAARRLPSCLRTHSDKNGRPLIPYTALCATRQVLERCPLLTELYADDCPIGV